MILIVRYLNAIYSVVFKCQSVVWRAALIVFHKQAFSCLSDSTYHGLFCASLRTHKNMASQHYQWPNTSQGTSKTPPAFHLFMKNRFIITLPPMSVAPTVHLSGNIVYQHFCGSAGVTHHVCTVQFHLAVDSIGFFSNNKDKDRRVTQGEEDRKGNITAVSAANLPG